MHGIETPVNHISRSFIKVQRIAEFLETVAILIVLAILLVLCKMFGWYSWIEYSLWILACLVVPYAVWTVGVGPMLMQRYWRYDVGEEFVQLQHGRLIRTNQIIPMTKIQYVELAQGPLLRSQGLYRVEIGTMGSNHAIPGLLEHEAYAVRARIAELAKIKEVEA